MADPSQYPQPFQGVRPPISSQNAGNYVNSGPLMGPQPQGMAPVQKPFSNQPPVGMQQPPGPLSTGSTFNGQGGGPPGPGPYGQNRFPGPGGPPPSRFTPPQHGGPPPLSQGQPSQGGPPSRFGPPPGQGGPPPPRIGAPPQGQPQRFPPTSNLGPQGPSFNPVSQGQMRGPPPPGGTNTGLDGPPFGASPNFNGPPMGVRPPTSQGGQGFHGQQIRPTSQKTETPTSWSPPNLPGSGPPPPPHSVSSQGPGASPIMNYGSSGPLPPGPPTSQSLGGQPSPRGPTQFSNLSGNPPQGLDQPPPPHSNQGFGQAPPTSFPNAGPLPPRLGGPPVSVSGAPLTSGSGMPPMSAVGAQLHPPPGPPTGQPGGLAPPPTGYLGRATTPNELPKPFHGQATYSHTIAYHPNSATPTPMGSEPPSERSSRDSSPVPNQQYDVLEGQFINQGSGPTPPVVTPSATPPPQDMRAGITGRRQYPQMTQGYGQAQAQGYGQPNPAPHGQQGFGQPPPAAGHGQPPPPHGQGFSQPPPPLGGPGQMGGAYTQQPHGGHPPGSTPGYPQPHGATTGYSQPPSGPPGFPQPHGQPGQMGNSMAYGDGLNSSFGKLNFQSPESRVLNLLQERQVIPPEGVETARPNLAPDFKKLNCSPDIFRCTLTNMPHSQSLLNKARLPLGVLIHPFKDLTQLPVIQSSVIVRCRSCRTYINPFVTFIDQRRWKCNLCFRVNEAPEEFQYDPVSKTFGDPTRRPEMKSATIEFIASSEYMLRPPQPAVYLFLLDVSFNAISTGYLSSFCQILDDELERIPGDARTQIGFITYDSSLYYFNLSEGLSAPQLLVVSDIDDIFLPMPDGLLTNLRDCKDLIKDLLCQLPKMFEGNKETSSALGAAMQAGFKLMTATGGRISVFQTCLPSVGPGALQAREDPNARAGKSVTNLGPATDFYKKFALDCSAQQIAVDIFFLNGQYADIASIACASKFSGGDLHYYPTLHSIANPAEVERFENDLRRYLTRKIGFESVMRVRCTKGLSIHTFHGNFFVRSTDLLSLPNINPDAGFGMQVSIEDTLNESSTVSFQAALLYTSSKGERRIRVHNLCLPVTNQLSDVFSGADQHAVAGLLAKMAVDRSLSSSLMDAREAMVNACLDSISAYASSIPAAQRIGTLPCCHSLRLLPMYTLALLKSTAFRVGLSTKLDDRVFFMEMCKALPLNYLLLKVYPDLYPVHNLDDKNSVNRDDQIIPQPPHLQLSSANLDRHGVFLLDAGDEMYMYVGGAVSDQFCQEVLEKPNFLSIPEGMADLPELENPTSERLRNFINYLQDQRPYHSRFMVVREDSKVRMQFFKYMVEDKTESSMSYYEYLQSIQKQLKG